MNFRQLATTFVSTGTPFGLFMALIFGFQFGEWWGAVAGVAAGILFGSAITLFVLLMSNRMRIRDNFENEPVLWQEPANHVLGIEARGGWLVLTPTRLAFRTHGLNFQNQQIDIPRTDILSAQPGRSFGFLPNLLRLILISGNTQTFVVIGISTSMCKLMPSTLPCSPSALFFAVRTSVSSSADMIGTLKLSMPKRPTSNRAGYPASAWFVRVLTMLTSIVGLGWLGVSLI